MLRGEKEPASGSIDRYQIEREGDDVYLKMRSFSTSREWITLLLNQLLAGKRFKIPSKVAGLLERRGGDQRSAVPAPHRALARRRARCEVERSSGRVGRQQDVRDVQPRPEHGPGPCSFQGRGRSLPRLDRPAGHLRGKVSGASPDRKSVVWGKRVSVRVDLGGR